MILLIQESKISTVEVNKYKLKFWGGSFFFAKDSIGQSGGLITFWDPLRLECRMESSLDSWMGVLYNYLDISKLFSLLNVYASHKFHLNKEC